MSKASKFLALGVGALLWAGTASAQPYQLEFQGDYVRLSSGGDHLNTFGVAAGWFFQPVKGAHGPYAEDAFLERAGSIWGLGAWSEGEFEVFGQDIDVETQTLGAELEYMAPGSPFEAKLTYAHSWMDFEDGDAEGDTDLIGLQLGYFVQRSLLVGFRYQHLRTEIEDEDESANEYGIFGKWVGLLAHDQAVNVEVGASIVNFDAEDDDGTNVVFSLAGDYYFSRAFSLGLNFASNSGDDDSAEGTTMGARAQYFITPTFAVRASLEKFYAEEDGVDDETTFNLGVTARF